MASQYTSKQELNGAYLIREQAILSLAEAITRFAEEPPSVTVQMAGDQELSSKDLSDIVSDSALLGGLIKRVSFYVNHYPPKAGLSRQVSIWMEKSALDKPVKITIAGEKARVLSLRQEIGDIFSAEKAAYSFFATRIGIIAGSVTAFILLFGMYLAYAMAFTRWAHFDSSIGGWCIVLSGITLAFCMWFRSFLFPNLSFDIGRSGKRYAVVAAFRNTIIVVIALGLIIGLASSYLFQWLSGAA